MKRIFVSRRADRRPLRRFAAASGPARGATGRLQFLDDDLSVRRGRWAEDLLSGGGAEGRADHFAASRLSVVVPDVRDADSAAGRPLSSRRAGLPWVRRERRSAGVRIPLIRSTISRKWSTISRKSIGLRQYVLYQQDYGGPIGMRLAVAHPERVRRSSSRTRSRTRWTRAGLGHSPGVLEGPRGL